MKGLESLVRRTTPSSFTYLCERIGTSLIDKVVIYVVHNIFLMCRISVNHLIYYTFQMDELACFAPGMIALGSSGYAPDEAKKYLSLAEEVNMPTSFLSFLSDAPMR